MEKLYYYLDAASQQIGPLTIDELKQMLLFESISQETLVWTEGLAEWVPLSTQLDTTAAPLSAVEDTDEPGLVPDTDNEGETVLHRWKNKILGTKRKKIAVASGLAAILILLPLSIYLVTSDSESPSNTELTHAKKGKHKTKKKVGDKNDKDKFVLREEPWTPALEGNMKLLLQQEGNYEDALIEALDRKEYTIAKKLIDDGARIKDPKVGQKVVKALVNQENLPLLRYVLDKGATPSMFELDYSVKSDDVWKLLEKYGLDVSLDDEGKSSLVYVLCRDDANHYLLNRIIQRTDIGALSDSDYKRALSLCCRKERVDLLPTLIEKGLDKHKSVGGLALTCACESNNEQLVTKLLGMGIKPEDSIEELDVEDALRRASMGIKTEESIEGHIHSQPIWEKLSAAGVKLNKDKALLEALWHEDEDMALYLMDSGANVNYSTGWNLMGKIDCYPLRVARSQRMQQALIARGARKDGPLMPADIQRKLIVGLLACDKKKDAIRVSIMPNASNEKLAHLALNVAPAVRQANLPNWFKNYVLIHEPEIAYRLAKLYIEKNAALDKVLDAYLSVIGEQMKKNGGNLPSSDTVEEILNEDSDLSIEDGSQKTSLSSSSSSSSPVSGSSSASDTFDDALTSGSYPDWFVKYANEHQVDIKAHYQFRNQRRAGCCTYPDILNDYYNTVGRLRNEYGGRTPNSTIVENIITSSDVAASR